MNRNRLLPDDKFHAEDADLQLQLVDVLFPQDDVVGQPPVLLEEGLEAFRRSFLRLARHLYHLRFDPVDVALQRFIRNKASDRF